MTNAIFSKQKAKLPHKRCYDLSKVDSKLFAYIGITIIPSLKSEEYYLKQSRLLLLTSTPTLDSNTSFIFAIHDSVINRCHSLSQQERRNFLRDNAISNLSSLNSTPYRAALSHQVHQISAGIAIICSL